MKLAFCDLETTGLDPAKHGIWSIALILQVNGKVLDKLDYRCRPFVQDIVDPEALKIGHTSAEQIIQYPKPTDIYQALTIKLGCHVDKYDRSDKFHFIGYNALFDYQFLRRFWEKNSDQWFGSWFWHPPIDIMTIAGAALMDKRHLLANFRQSTVYEHLFGDPPPVHQLHSAIHDVQLTMALYDLLVGQDIDKLVDSELGRAEQITELLDDTAKTE